MRKFLSLWPDWVATAAAGWAALFALVLSATAVFGGRRVLNVPYVTWPLILILAVGAAVAWWARRLPVRVVTIGESVVAGLALAASCWVLLDLVSLAMTGRVKDAHGHSSWPTFAERLGFVLTGVLFAAAAVAWRRRSGGLCGRCGQVHPPGLTGRRYPAPHAAPLPVRRIAYAGCLAFLPYTAAHTLGALGVPGIEPAGFRPPLVWVVPLLGGIGLAVFLLLGLVRPWGMVFPRWTLWFSGRRVPRFLPLTPVWLIAPTLSIYGVVLLIVAAVVEPSLLIAAAGVSFGGYGIPLLVAAVSYQRRTRPVCA